MNTWIKKSVHYIVASATPARFRVVVLLETPLLLKSRKRVKTEEKERAEEEEGDGDETSPQVACGNTGKRSGRFVLGG